MTFGFILLNLLTSLTYASQKPKHPCETIGSLAINILNESL
ncbi:hypothetical protein HJ01_02683 [Flavobacterium frigoris PS1]|uniref:Uncharacterized protein n=1 Tax=Flavobacterium frigoris (strain PS1) TaxID=1086011 RepID=H7FUD8_FLAFP|nr:hypothetical protein HJ01_02683 [Flavobacterium frigoris PS1]